jgi:cytochrome c biogenesis protein CcmG/thiol:disulfide interchange protein DsbE
MNRSLLLTTVALVLCVAAGAKPWPRGQQDANHPHSSGPEIGTAAPDFTLKVVDGKGETMQLSSLQGKAVLVNFWATWCEPCKIEMPWLAELQKKYGPEGLQIIGVAVDDADAKTISDFAHKMGVNYPVLQGTEKVADMYGGVEGLPTSFFIDRSGKVSDKILGLVSESVIEDAIKKSLEQKGDTKTAAAK